MGWGGVRGDYPAREERARQGSFSKITKTKANEKNS